MAVDEVYDYLYDDRRSSGLIGLPQAPPSSFTSSASIDDHDHKYDPPARVIVGETEIPVINEGIRTEIRKDGPLSINRHSEVFFPAEWEGEEYQNVVRALDPNESSVYDKVDIQIKDSVTDEFTTVHRGFVMATGAGRDGNIEKRMHAGDVSQLMGAIPFGESYGSQSTASDVLRDCVIFIEDTISPEIFESVEVMTRDGSDILEPFDHRFEGLEPANPADLLGHISFFADLGRSLFGSSGTDFEFGKDTVQDALNWLIDHLDVWIYFAPHPDEDTISLIVEENPNNTTFFASHVDVDDVFDAPLGIDVFSRIDVIKNNVLFEITPLNTVTVRGEGYVPSSDAEHERIPEAVAVHPILREKAGMPLQPSLIHIESSDISVVEESAREELKTMLDGAATGDIVAEPSPAVTPFNTVISQTVCGDRIEYDAPPLEYEIEEVVHQIAAKDEEGQRYHQTTIRAGPRIDTKDINVQSDAIRGEEVNDSNRLWDRLRFTGPISGPFAPLFG